MQKYETYDDHDNADCQRKKSPPCQFFIDKNVKNILITYFRAHNRPHLPMRQMNETCDKRIMNVAHKGMRAGFQNKVSNIN